MSKGHQITLVARGSHLDAMKYQGLKLTHPEIDFHGPVEACSMDQLIDHYKPSHFDILLVCAKATATQVLSEQLESWFSTTGESTMIVSLQNGIDNEIQLAERVGAEHVIGGLAVRIGAHIVTPGHIEATGPAQVIWGIWHDTDAIADLDQTDSLLAWTKLFNDAHIPTKLVPDIKKELWLKLVINNGVNPISALTGLDTKELSHHPDLGPIVWGMMCEAAQAAVTDDVKLNNDDVKQMFTLIKEFDAIKTSMLVDFEMGRPLELDSISGVVIERCADLGLEAPYTRCIEALLRYRLIVR